MPWVYDYQAGPVGSLEDLSDYCTFVRVLTEPSIGRRGKNPVVQYRHGESVSPRKYVRPAKVLLETGLRYTNASGVVTHTDGEAGHVFENLSHLKRIFGGLQDQTVRLQRTVPHQGTVYLDVELLADAAMSQARHVFLWPLRAPHPFWIGAADTGNTPPTLTVAGDAPIGDAVVKFTGTANGAKLTHDDSGAYIEIEGDLPTGGVVVDIGAGTCERITGGADWSQYLNPSDEWMIELDPGVNGVTVSQVSGTPTVSVDWYTQWR